MTEGGAGDAGGESPATIRPMLEPMLMLAQDAGGGLRLRELFLQSFDLFTILLVLGSVVAVAVIARCVIEVRAGAILPEASERQIRGLIRDGRIDELRGWAAKDSAFVSKVVHAALSVPGQKPAMREAAELCASEQCARLFRKIDLLSVIGNLGPLLGLAGTVWGMIIAFAALGEAGGQASPAALSSGIAKALFHTLLGLMLAVPALAFYGVYRNVVDRLCNRAMALSAELVELLPAGDSASRKPD